MRNDSLNDFDLSLRSMLQDAQEEVPAGVWESLSGELDRRDRRKVVALRWRRTAISVAAAAAVLSGAFVITRHSMPQGPSEPQSVVAQTIQEQESPAVEAAEEILSIEEQIAASPRSRFAQAQEPQQSAASSEQVVPSEAVPAAAFDKVGDVQVSEEPQSAPQGDKAQDRQEETSWNDPFAQLEDEEEMRSIGKSFSLSGNAMSNDITGSSRAMRAPVAATTTTTGVQEKSVSTYGIPLSLGVGARFDITDKLSIGTGIEWTLLSRSFTGIYTEVSGGMVVKSINSEINNEIHYIGIPLNLYYNIMTNRNLKFYVWGGGSAEKGLVNSYRIQNGASDIMYRKSVDGLQWSTALGLGLEFALNDCLGLYIDPSARYYFDCGQPTSVRTQKPYMLNFEVGLRFNL